MARKRHEVPGLMGSLSEYFFISTQSFHIELFEISHLNSIESDEFKFFT